MEIISNGRWKFLIYNDYVDSKINKNAKDGWMAHRYQRNVHL